MNCQSILQSRDEPWIGCRIYLKDNRQLAWQDCWKQADGAVINHSEACAVLNQEGTLGRDLTQFQRLIITGTENDPVVAERSAANILQPLTELAPVTYLPDFGTTYGNDPTKLTAGGIDAYVNHLKHLIRANGSTDSSIEICPIIKGHHAQHFRRQKEVFERIEHDTIAFYAAEYFGSAVGNGLETVLDELRIAIKVFDPAQVLVVGLGSPTALSRLPPRVTATCYFRRWFEAALTTAGDPTAVNAQIETARTALHSLADRQMRLAECQPAEG